MTQYSLIPGRWNLALDDLLFSIVLARFLSSPMSHPKTVDTILDQDQRGDAVCKDFTDCCNKFMPESDG